MFSENVENVQLYRGDYRIVEGAQWLSGRVLDSRPRRHCFVVLEQDTFILA